jgi:hypothetical protein
LKQTVSLAACFLLEVGDMSKQNEKRSFLSSGSLRGLRLARLVVVVLLGVWTFPAVSLAKPGPATSAEVEGGPFRSRARTAPEAATGGEAADLAAREQRAKDLQDFRGGEGVYIYVGSGVLLVVIIVLLLLLL